MSNEFDSFFSEMGESLDIDVEALVEEEESKESRLPENVEGFAGGFPEWNLVPPDDDFFGARRDAQQEEPADMGFDFGDLTGEAAADESDGYAAEDAGYGDSGAGYAAQDEGYAAEEGGETVDGGGYSAEEDDQGYSAEDDVVVDEEA